jgi:predicted nucleic acid-binding protein
LAIVPCSLASVPEKKELDKLGKIVNKKDVHVIAAALNVRASILLTLDKELISEVNRVGMDIRAVMLGEFIKTILPKHEDYLSKTS